MNYILYSYCQGVGYGLRIVGGALGLRDRDVGARGAEALRVVWRVWHFGDRSVLRVDRIPPGPRPGRCRRVRRGGGRPARGPRSSRTRRPRADALSDDRGEQPPLEEWAVCDGQRYRAAAAV